MSITQTNVSSPSQEIIFLDTAMGATVDSVKATSAQVYSISVNNLLNASPVYVKLYNLASGSVTVGTTAPDEVIYVPAGLIIPVFYFTGAAPGKVFASALSAFAVTTGGTAGSTSPSSATIVTINYV